MRDWTSNVISLDPITGSGTPGGEMSDDGSHPSELSNGFLVPQRLSRFAELSLRRRDIPRHGIARELDESLGPVR